MTSEQYLQYKSLIEKLDDTMNTIREIQPNDRSEEDKILNIAHSDIRRIRGYLHSELLTIGPPQT